MTRTVLHTVSALCIFLGLQACGKKAHEKSADDFAQQIQSLDASLIEEATRDLYDALRQANPRTFSVLLRGNVNLSTVFEDGETLLTKAIKLNSPFIEKILTQDRVDINQPNAAGETPLMAAAASGNTPIVRRLLVMRELDPDIQDRDGNTALMIAIRMKQTEVAKTILNTSRARRDIKNRENEDAARIAEAKNLNEILRIIRREQDLKNGAPDIAIIADMITSDPLFRLTETLTSYPDIIRDYDASLDPYILVIKNRKPDVAVAMMELLFRNNADPNGSNDSGTRPLIESVKLKNLAYVDFFLSKRSVDVNAKDAELKTALIHAVQANDDELTIRILRRYPSKRYTIRGSDGTKVRYNACEESCKVNQTLTSVEERRENENIRRALRCGPYSCLF